MSVFTTKKFWVDTAERAIKTFAQVAGSAIIASGVLGLIDLNYVETASIAGLATLLSLLSSIGSAGVGDKESASLVVATKEVK